MNKTKKFIYNQKKRYSKSSKMSKQIRITVSNEIDKLLSKVCNKLGKKKSMLARELMEQKLYDLNLIQKGLEDLK